MTPFATVDDLAAGWRPITDAEQERAQVLLERASALIASLLETSGIDFQDPREPFATNLVSVTCNVARRALSAGIDTPPASQYTQSAVGYSETYSFSNPHGDLYLTANEKRSLGIGRGRIRSIPPKIWGR